MKKNELFLRLQNDPIINSHSHHLQDKDHYGLRVSVKISDSLIRYDQRQRSLSKCRQIAENMMTNSRKELFV